MVTETSHTRSRRASLFGLLLQLLVFAGLIILAQVTNSFTLSTLAWYVGGGLPLWFVCLLYFRQRELVDLEAMDLEELRRERQSTGGEALFEQEGGGSLGFRVAENRLRWMQRWLIPAFALLEVVYLGVLGALQFYAASQIDLKLWGQLHNLPLAMIVLAVVMLVLFLFARYSAGMGRVAQWQHLRACGSYMIGNSLATLALIICLGIYMYAGVSTPVRVLAFVIPGLMILLAIETLLTFTMDIYRPRREGEEARAAFDSRLLALVAEPGGIASTIAEAINYQFGFEVSQTWFYQLLQRALVPLIGVGLLVLWLLTAIVVVQPGEHVIIERFGRQLNTGAEGQPAPHGPGFYLKLPWPIEVAQKYDTGRLHQIYVGFRQFDASAKIDEHEHATGKPALWDDEQHLGQNHFDFLIPVPPATDLNIAGPGATLLQAVQPAARAALVRGREQALPVNMVRMTVAVQYKIREDRLLAYTRAMANPHDTLRDIAWDVVVRYNASSHIHELLGEKYGIAGGEIQRQIQQAVDGLDLGLEIVYVGVQNVHPEPGVSREFRNVVKAEQEKIASIREALVRQNEVLAAVAGDRELALSLAQAVTSVAPYETQLDTSAEAVAQWPSDTIDRILDALLAQRTVFREIVEARAARAQAEQSLERVRDDFEIGLEDQRGLRAAEQLLAQSEAELARARESLATALEPLREAEADQMPAAEFAEIVRQAEALVGLEYWNERLQNLLPLIQGQASAHLAAAQAERWTRELEAAGEVAVVSGERDAYRAAPDVYRARRYIEAIVIGIKDSRKMFLAFHPGERAVHIRYQAEEQARPDISEAEVRQR